MDVAWWRGVPYVKRRGEMYRPVCRTCLCDAPGHCTSGCSCHERLQAPVVDCQVCGHQLAYTAAPEGRGTWRDRLNVCSIGCLNDAQAEAPPEPPEPRRCTWCGHTFTPARRGDARLCSPRCRQAKRRAQPVPDYDVEAARALLDELGVEPGEPLAPRWADVVADTLNRLMADEP